MTDQTLEQRARGLLASEFPLADGFSAVLVRDMSIPQLGVVDTAIALRAIVAALQAQQPVTLREVTMEDMANACDAYRREQPASNDLAHPKAMFAALRAILPHGIPALAELDAQPAPAPVQVDKRDREADRQRFPDAQFNVWLDEGISDCGHTVWDAIGDVCDAWQGWKARQFYAHPQPPSIPEPSELRKVAKRCLRSYIENGSDDKALMLKCLEELS